MRIGRLCIPHIPEPRLRLLGGVLGHIFLVLHCAVRNFARGRFGRIRSCVNLSGCFFLGCFSHFVQKVSVEEFFITDEFKWDFVLVLVSAPDARIFDSEEGHCFGIGHKRALYS